MARNSSGTFTLATGNPVVSGTTISSTTHNNTMSDIATEMTDSLSRSGKGPMLAPLEATDGTAAAPSVTFDSDTDTGLYLKGANNIGIAAGGAEVVDVTTSGAAVTGTFSVSSTSVLTGAITSGITVTQSASNTAAITATGNGSGNGITVTGGATGAGLVATGGATGGNGGTFTGTGTAGDGVHATGKGSGQGGDFTGGDSDGTGVDARGGATNGIGIYAEGSGTGVAIQAHTGHIYLSGGNPSSSTGFTNRLTPLNVPKAWAIFTSSGTAATQTVSGGFNITSIVLADNGGIGEFTVTFATALANANYVVTYGTTQSGAAHPWTRSSRAAGSFKLALVNMSTGTSLSVAGGSGVIVELVVFGAQ